MWRKPVKTEQPACDVSPRLNNLLRLLVPSDTKDETFDAQASLMSCGSVKLKEPK